MLKNQVLILCLICMSAPSLAAPPDTPKRPVTDKYHGVEVVDPYRWLENAKDPEVRKWSDAQCECLRLLALPLGCGGEGLTADARRRRVEDGLGGGKMDGRAKP